MPFCVLGWSDCIECVLADMCPDAIMDVELLEQIILKRGVEFTYEMSFALGDNYCHTSGVEDSPFRCWNAMISFWKEKAKCTAAH